MTEQEFDKAKFHKCWEKLELEHFGTKPRRYAKGNLIGVLHPEGHLIGYFLSGMRISSFFCQENGNPTTMKWVPGKKENSLVKSTMLLVLRKTSCRCE